MTPEPPADPCPAPWSCTDIGNPAPGDTTTPGTARSPWRAPGPASAARPTRALRVPVGLGETLVASRDDAGPGVSSRRPD